MTRLTFLITLITLTFTGVMLASGVRSQNVKNVNITIATKNVALKDALTELEKRSGFSFVYSEDIGNITGVTLQGKTTTLYEVLKTIAKQKGLQFNQQGYLIAVFKMPPPPSPGKMHGVVMDEKGQSLPGATLKITETGQIMQAAVDGSYNFSLPPGTYTLEVSFISYQTQKVTGIVVAEGRATSLNIAMKPLSNTLNEVMVTATYKKASIEGLYMRQKNAAGITDGISADQISRTPDKNMGESLRRISGLSTVDNKYVVVRGLSERYNQAMLNGQALPSTELNRKQFSFDIIPANMVDNVTVYKSITPDKSAEFGGGLVEVNTRDIPDENFYSVTAGGTINELTRGKDMVTYERSSSDFLGNYSDSRKIYGQNFNSLADIRACKAANGTNAALSNNWQPYFHKAQPSQNYQFSGGRVIILDSATHKSLGVLASLGYRNTQQIQELASSRYGFGFDNTGDDLSSFLNGQRSTISNNIAALLSTAYRAEKTKLKWQNVYTRLLDEQYNFGRGYNQNMGNNSRALIENVQLSDLLQSQLSGEHTITKSGIKFNWTGSFTYVSRDRPDNHVGLWRTLADNDPLPHNDFTVAGYGSELLGTTGGMLRMTTGTREKNFSWTADWSFPFKLGITKNTFKTGYAGWLKDRQFFVALLGHKPNADAPNFAPSLGDLFSDRYGPVTDYISTFGDDYKRKAQLHAAYGMFDNHIGNKLRLVWGIRAEWYDINAGNQALDALVAD